MLYGMDSFLWLSYYEIDLKLDYYYNLTKFSIERSHKLPFWNKKKLSPKEVKEPGELVYGGAFSLGMLEHNKVLKFEDFPVSSESILRNLQTCSEWSEIQRKEAVSMTITVKNGQIVSFSCEAMWWEDLPWED